MEAISALLEAHGVALDDELAYLVRYTAYAYFNSVNRWHKSGHEYAPKELAQYLLHCLPGRLSEILENISVLA